MKRVVIIGSGESGVGAAVLARMKGYDVFVSDSGSIKPQFRQLLDQHNISWEEGGHTEESVVDASEIIKSPGVPESSPMLKKIRAAGIPVISEIEFASRFTDAKIIGITGSNGKTTTTLLTYHILRKAGLNAGLAGNVGRSFALQVATSLFDIYVLELSSFQLDDIDKFRPDIAILLNITPDHLDRYEYKMENYVSSKFRITMNQTGDQHFIYCADDPETVKRLNEKPVAAATIPFSLSPVEGNGAHTENGRLIINYKNDPFIMTLEELALQGKHNIYNSMAAGIAGRILDIRKDLIRESLADFQNIEHRLEFVAKINGVEFINDSKATNVNSTWYALESMEDPVIWIAGGVDKGNDYTQLADLVKKKVKAIVCLGKDNGKIISAFKDIVPVIEESGSAADAVKKAFRHGKKGDVVLLSPACASFDLFENYEDRGTQFKKAVRQL